MTQLSSNSPRAYEEGQYNDLPVLTAIKIYEGSAIGSSSGYARQLVAGDTFLGFAQEKVDNTDGASGALNVRTRQEGLIELSVAGVTGVTNVGSTVYASDGNTFTLASTSNSAIGKIVRWVSGTTCIVKFQAVAQRSI